jgi:hypothetical protein
VEYLERPRDRPPLRGQWLLCRQGSARRICEPFTDSAAQGQAWRLHLKTVMRCACPAPLPLPQATRPRRACGPPGLVAQCGCTVTTLSATGTPIPTQSLGHIGWPGASTAGPSPPALSLPVEAASLTGPSAHDVSQTETRKRCPVASCGGSGVLDAPIAHGHRQGPCQSKGAAPGLAKVPAPATPPAAHKEGRHLPPLPACVPGHALLFCRGSTLGFASATR